MYTRDYIIKCIKDYAGEYLIDPRKNMPLNLFDLTAYRKAAIKEILFRVEQSDGDVLDVVQDFVDRTLLYSRKSKAKNTRQMLRVMHEMGEDILDFLYAMEGERNG